MQKQRNMGSLQGTNTVKILIAPKDKHHKLQKSGIIYKFKYPHKNCPELHMVHYSTKGSPQNSV